MKLPFQMLLDFVETRLDAQAVGDLLTMAGFELEGIETVEGDEVLDVKVMSNRGDGLSAFGLAREILAKDDSAKPTKLYEGACARFSLGDENERCGPPARLETPDCDRYAYRLFSDVPRGAAPDRIQQRLRQAGMRPISAVVDITNYVMLELGQPLHAFDMDRLRGSGQIIVRKAKPGEKLTTLDGEEHELNANQMMICDAERPVAAAGIMGGLDSEVTDVTRRMLLESAHFESTSIRRTRKELGLSTEASYRFERSVDPDGVVAALNRFAILLAEIDGGRSRLGGVSDAYPSPYKAQPITLSAKRAESLLGMAVGVDAARRYLTRLGFRVEGAGDELAVWTPSWRPDVVREEDVVEEIGRVHGFDKIPEALPHGATLQGGVFGLEARVDRFRERLVRLGFQQTMSHSLGSRHPLDDPSLEPIGPRIAASPEHAFLRSSLLASVADAARRNGGKDLHLFEIGRVFGRRGREYVERRNVAILSVGNLYPTNLKSDPTIPADFSAMKTVLAESLGEGFVLGSGDDHRFHPTRQAAVLVDGQGIGIMGQIHPDAAEGAGVSEEAVLVELDLEKALASEVREIRYRPVSKNPSVRRDIAILIAKSKPFREVEEAIEGACGDVLERHWLFDIYEGKGIPEGMHSLAIALQLRKHGANFTDEEANQVRERAVQALAKLGATQR